MQDNEKPEADVLDQQRDLDAGVDAPTAGAEVQADDLTEMEADPADVRDQRWTADEAGDEDDYPPE